MGMTEGVIISIQESPLPVCRLGGVCQHTLWDGSILFERGGSGRSSKKETPLMTTRMRVNCGVWFYFVFKSGAGMTASR
jgi:hypothetical protein